jgi:hypothetical protein
VTCDHVFSGSVDVPLICCSPPAPVLVIANLTGPPPALMVRNM